MKRDFQNNLDNFLSVIWKENEFNTSEEGEKALFKSVPGSVKSVMFWYYIGSMNFIRQKFPRIFPDSSDNTESFSVFDMQQRVVDELAAGDVTKKDAVKKSLMYEVFYTIDNAIERDEKMKKK